MRTNLYIFFFIPFSHITMIYLVININNDYKSTNQDNMMQKGTLLGIISLAALVAYVGYNEFPSQTAVAAGSDRVYMHGIVLRNTIDNAQYTNGDPVGALPEFSKVTIINWDDVKATDKTLIITQATADGYSVAP